MSSVEFRNVFKTFPSRNKSKVAAVEEVSFRAESGEFLALLGPSGCGKTTLLRILAGLEAADSGDVLIAGKRVNELPAAKRNIAMVFQSYALYPHLSVRENIVFGLKVRKVPERERQERLQYAAGVLGLEEYLDRRPSELSGGQRQRVALGRAIVSQAKVVLMDEPLSNLDAKLRHQMRTELRDLQRRLGLTVVYVTHDQVEAMTMADRVVVMRRGHVEQVDSPIELYREPATVTVAGFVGSPPMNLIPITIESGRASASFEHGSWSDTVPAALGDSDTALLGIRAEALSIAAGTGRLAGRVLSVEYLGADTVMSVALDAGTTVVARLPGVALQEVGSIVQLDYPVSEARYFDAGTGQRLDAVQRAAQAPLATEVTPS